MADCKWCSNSGWLVSVDAAFGVCTDCYSRVAMDIKRRDQLISQSLAILRKTKNRGTRISRLSVMIESLEALLPYVARGILSIEPPPTSKIQQLKLEREKLLSEAAQDAPKSSRKVKARKVDNSSMVRHGVLSEDESKEMEDSVEVWQTEEDDVVCAQCKANSGRITGDRPGDPPIPCRNCRCEWRRVPRWYADLLRSDPLKAKELDRQGKVPHYLEDSKTGKPVAILRVEFS